ncbi:MAG: type II toxin-antitoxin system RelE/ParE family toxin [Novosphingobium sp.]
MPYSIIVQTVIETEAYLRAAKDAGMAEAEREAAVELVATNPEGGDVLQGTGGVRKTRLAGRGKGKSGGYRIVWYFGGDDIPVFLLTVFGKGEKANLSQGERNALRSLTATLRGSLGAG